VTETEPTAPVAKAIATEPVPKAPIPQPEDRFHPWKATVESTMSC